MRSLSFDLRVPKRAPAIAAEPDAVEPRPLSNLQPRQWQTQLIQLLRRRLETRQGSDVLINAGPGAGKTLGALLSFERLLREGRLERFLVCLLYTSPSPRD